MMTMKNNTLSLLFIYTNRQKYQRERRVKAIARQVQFSLYNSVSLEMKPLALLGLAVVLPKTVSV